MFLTSFVKLVLIWWFSWCFFYFMCRTNLCWHSAFD